MNVLPLYLPHLGCPHRCAYCNQHLTVNAPNDRAEWTERLQAIENTPPDESWEIAFYGGTFSALSFQEMSRYFKRIEPYLKRPNVRGARISTRPDCVDENRLNFLQNHGVRTIELGVESLDDAVLNRCNRGHSAEDSQKGCGRVRRFGFQLGIHLMCGLPGQTERSWLETVEQTVKLKPSFVRIAPTLVLEGTALESMLCQGAYHPLSLEEAIRQCGLAYTRFHRSGIPIARVGLALSDREGDGSNKIIAGPWHPSLRHEVESRLAADSVLSILKTTRESTVKVNPKDISITVGPKRENVDFWRRELGRTIRAIQDPQQVRHSFGTGSNTNHSLFYSINETAIN